MMKEIKGPYFIVCGYTDLRRGIDGLAGIIHDRIKALLWEGDGFLLLYKRLDNGRFQWPRNKTEAEQITAEQYTWLMQGLAIEQPKAIKQASKRPDII